MTDMIPNELAKEVAAQPGPLTATDLMPYGKHKGTTMANIPADYLLWLYDNDKCTPPVSHYVEDNMDILRSQQVKEVAERKKTLQARMPFGSYKGIEICEVPAEYLLVLYESDKCPPNVLEYIEQNMAAIERQAEKDSANRNILRSLYL